MTVWTTNPDQLKLLNNLTAEFSKTHGGGEVELQSIPQAEYLTKISIRLSGGTPPDLGWMGAPDAVEMAKNGQLVHLGPDLKSAWPEVLQTSAPICERAGRHEQSVPAARSAAEARQRRALTP